MAKQEFEQGDSNVVVRNQVVYGALPQDVIDRMGDTTLALQTTEQNVLPAINELKSNLTELQYNNIGAAINLTADTDYVTLSDGYFVLTFNGGDVSGNHYAYGNVDGVKLIALNSPKTVATFGYEATAVYVRKGSVIKFTGDSLARGAFRPLIAPTP